MKPIIGILDDFDAPEAENLVIIQPRKSGGFHWVYLSRDRPFRATHVEHIPHLFTDAAMFGISMSLDGGILTTEQTGLSLAVYPNDWKPRNWQGQNKPTSIAVMPLLIPPLVQALAA